MTEAENLAAIIESQIKQSLDSYISVYIKKSIEELALNPSWIDRVEKTINQEFARKFAERISLIDFNALFSQHLDAALDQWRNKLLQDFKTKGISNTW